MTATTYPRTEEPRRPADVASEVREASGRTADVNHPTGRIRVALEDGETEPPAGFAADVLAAAGYEIEEIDETRHTRTAVYSR